jgi:hypothetical protein
MTDEALLREIDEWIAAQRYIAGTISLETVRRCRAALASAPVGAEPGDGYADYMCPNCVTPWKCNGPHIPESHGAEPAKGADAPENVFTRDSFGGGLIPAPNLTYEEIREQLSTRASPSKAEGEVTTGQAELVLDIDGFVKRYPHSPARRVLGACRAMIESLARERDELVHDNARLYASLNGEANARIVAESENASLRAKLAEAQTKIAMLDGALGDISSARDIHEAAEMIWKRVRACRQSAQAASQPSNPET